MSIIASAVMVVSLGIEVAAEGANCETVTVTQMAGATNSKVLTKTLFVGESVTVNVTGATKGKIKTSSTKRGIAKVECTKNGKVKFTALKAGTSTITIKNSSGKALAKYKIVVKKDTDTVLTMIDDYFGTQMYTSEIGFNLDDFKMDGDGSISAGGVVKIEQYDSSDFGMVLSLDIQQTSEDGRLMLSYKADLFKVYFFTSREQMYVDVGTTSNAVEKLKKCINSMPNPFKEEHGYEDLGVQLDQVMEVLKFYEEKTYIAIPYSELDSTSYYTGGVNFTDIMSNKQIEKTIVGLLGCDDETAKDIANILKDPSVIAETLSTFNVKLSRNLQKYAASAVSLSKDKKTAYFTVKPSNTGSIINAFSKFMKNDFTKVIDSEIARTNTLTGNTVHKKAMKSMNKMLKMLKATYTEEAALSFESLLDDYKQYFPEQLRQSGLDSIKIGVTDKSTKTEKAFNISADISFNETYLSTAPFKVGIAINSSSKKATKPTIRYDETTTFNAETLSDYIVSQGLNITILGMGSFVNTEIDMSTLY